MLFNNSQRRGIILLLILIVSLLIVPKLFLRQKHDLHLFQESASVQQISFNTEITPIAEKHNTKTDQKLELNTADSSSLVAIKGIGPYYASKIIHYREQLGGYHSLEQLKELKMKYWNADSLKRFFSVDPELLIKKDLDSMSFKEVLRHPYLDYEDVKLIFNAKRKYLKISLPVLEKNNILSIPLLKKIKPYFK